MKKILSIFLITLSALSLIGCIESTTTTTTTTTEPLPIELTIDQSEVLMGIGGSYQINYTLTNVPTSDSRVVTFTSENEAIATVTVLGEVTAIEAGSTQITIAFGDEASTTLTVNVSSSVRIVAPNKVIYALNDTLSLTGAKLELYNEENQFVEAISITSSMVSGFDSSKTGKHIVDVTYQGVNYGFEVLIMNAKQASARLADAIILNETITVGEKVELMMTQLDSETFLEAIENVYDYSEITIYGYVETPLETYQIKAFWFQDYTEQITYQTVNSNLNLEGMVANTDDDYDLKLTYKAENAPHYRMRFMPEIAGDYALTIVLVVDGEAIQTLTKSFQVTDGSETFNGYLQVDSTNQRHFVFEDGQSYIPVGQNVAWYTSSERKYYDYLNWFTKMGSANMNYARVWMAAWGFSIFWDDVEDYDQRQTNMMSLDRTLEIAEDNDIYIQLCLLHHGMFSASVNPMWPNSTNTWYTTKYGSNPYADHFSNSGLFFTSDYGKQTFKNQLDYILARWGYSDHIMSFELFNEVDWIETYSAVAGTAWHNEMASYIKANDPYDHMVTTSVKSDSFLSNVYQVFALDSIDYVNVHSYGIYNHLSTLPTKQNNGFEVFNKPIMYNEVGYSGNGGQDQLIKDPNNITLRQALWAGAMGGGGGTGMNWWWESWIEPSNAYSNYTGIANYLSHLDLTGNDYQVIAENDTDYHVATLSSSICDYMGYVVDDRIYVYIYDTSYTLNTPTAGLKSNVTFSINDRSEGVYIWEAYDTKSGTMIASDTLTVTDSQQVNLVLPSFSEDIAIIIQPLGD